MNLFTCISALTWNEVFVKKIILISPFIATCVVALFVIFTSVPAIIHHVAQEFFPSLIPWESHNAFRKCEYAIAGEMDWPFTDSQACVAMHMCANEAPLDSNEDSLLMSQIEKLSDCEAP